MNHLSFNKLICPMKNTLLMFFFFLTLSAFGQITVLDQDVTMELTPDEIEVHVDISIVNDYPNEVLFWWDIERGTSPTEWEYKVCDLVTCYDWGYETCPCSMENTFPSGNTAMMTFYLNPNEIEGTAVVNLRILDDCRKNPGGGVGYVDIPITITVESSVSVTEEDLVDQVYLFPNPVSDIFKLENDADISVVEIYNLVGKRMLESSHKPGNTHNISHLNKGIYLVRLLDKSNSIVKVITLTKV